MSIQAVPAFADNYLWLIAGGDCATVVDPGDAAVIQDALQTAGLQLDSILITHHHADHIGGVRELCAAYPEATVYGPVDRRIPASVRVAEGDTVHLESLGRSFTVYEVPGHTSSHIAYFGDDDLFCGDTIFASGCGRLFEGTPQQMQASLAKLRALPETTRVWCAHEYTLDNMEFARLVEPENTDLALAQQQAQALRADGMPTVPTTLAQEKRCNPFLRFDDPVVHAAACARLGRDDPEPFEVFGAIRDWKDEWDR